MVSTGHGAPLTTSCAVSGLGRCAAMTGSRRVTDITIASTDSFVAKSRIATVAEPKPRSKRIRLRKLEPWAMWSSIQLSTGLVNCSLLLADKGISCFTFIKVKFASYLSAKATAYSAALLESGANSNGYRIWRSPVLAGTDEVFGPTVRTGQDATLKISSAVEPSNSFFNV